jgi:hypothetical protein
MRIESLDCPNCGAPLPVTTAQTLAACVYCNSTIRIMPAGAGGTPATAVRAAEIGPEVIDEVKRLLLTSQHFPAVEYYAKQAGVDQAVAEKAVKAIEATIAYYPPLTVRGLIMLVALDVVFTAGLVGSGWLIYRGQYLAGIGLLLVCAFLMLGNVLVLSRGLRGFLTAQRGQPAAAEIRKVWIISQHKARVPYELMRLLLEVRPAGRAPYTTEANCFVTAPSKPKFHVGRLIQVKYDMNEPRRVVVVGAGEGD